MSDTILRIIPTEPTFVPTLEGLRQAQEVLKKALPNADDVRVEVFDSVQFVDAGSNFERVICPSCDKEIDIQQWQSAMNNAFETGFSNLQFKTSCCGREVSLNDLRYEMPQGFARFYLEAQNPSVQELDKNYLHQLEEILKSSLRVIWAHY